VLAIQGSWKGQKVHFHDLPRSLAHLANTWCFSRLLRGCVFSRVSSEDGKYQSSVLFQKTIALCASLSRRPEPGSEGWLLLAILLTDDLVQLGVLLGCLLFQKKRSPSRDSASKTISFAGRPPPGFISALC